MLGMIYLQDNSLLKEPLKVEHIKNRLLGHRRANPGLAFIYIHLNRLIKIQKIDVRDPARHGVVAARFSRSGFFGRCLL